METRTRGQQVGGTEAERERDGIVGCVCVFAVVFSLLHVCVFMHSCIITKFRLLLL
eukprot:SAG22_NODE_299_length_12768_cov_11.369426_8_plen_56_part_00